MRVHSLKLLTLTTLAAATLPLQAQGLVPDSQVRAINLARDTAVSLNGGLGVYNPDRCMFETTKLDNRCLVSNDANGYLFRFLGGVPGWQEDKVAPTLQTVIRVAPNGRSVVQTIYNGTPQP